MDLGLLSIVDDESKNVNQDSSNAQIGGEEEEQMGGYKQELFRGLSAFGSFAFGFTEVGIVSSITSLFGYGLITGGPACMLWGYSITFAFTMVVGCAMAEICAAYPSAGSVYHWAAQVVPERQAPLWAYITGWANFLGNVAGDSSFAYSFALFFSAAVEVSGGEQLDQQQTIGIAIAVLALWSCLNIFRVDSIAFMNNFAAFFQVTTLVMIILCVLLLPSDLSTGKEVFSRFYNDSGFDNNGYVVMIGMLFGVYAFTGYESPAHMAEETQGSTINAPMGIIYTIVASGVVGLAYIVSLLFATKDIDAAVNGENSSVPINIFIIACGSQWGEALAWMLVVNIFFGGISSVAVTGRITFALMRDKAFPHHDFFGRVHPTLQTPINSILFDAVIGIAFLLIGLDPKNGYTAFNSILSLCTIGFQVSYALPIALRLYFDLPGFPETPMNLGKWSRPTMWVSVIWLFGTAIIFFLPQAAPITPDSMNWASVVTSLVVLMCGINWHFNSQYTFKGPKRALSIMSTV